MSCSIYIRYKNDEIPLFDLEEANGSAQLIDPVLTEEINTAGTFTCAVPPDNPAYEYIHHNLSRVEIYGDVISRWSGRICVTEPDEKGLLNITAYGALSYLSDSVQIPKKYSKVTCRAFLQDLITKHNAFCNRMNLYSDGGERYATFVLGNVTVNKKVSCYTKWETTLESISQNLIENFGGYVLVEPVDGANALTYRIHYLANKKPTESAQKHIEVGRNLLTYSANMDTLDIATAIVPLGKSTGTATDKELDDSLTIKSLGDYYVYNANMVRDYGWRFQVVQFSEIDNVQELLSEAMEYLTNYQWDKLVLSVGAVDLFYMYEEEPMSIGDLVEVSSPTQTITNILAARTLNLLSPGDDTYTIGIGDNKSISAQTVAFNRLDGSKVKRTGVAYDDMEA